MISLLEADALDERPDADLDLKSWIHLKYYNAKQQLFEFDQFCAGMFLAVIEVSVEEDLE